MATSTAFPSAWLAGSLLACTLVAAWFIVQSARAIDRRMDFLEGTLDAVPQPITVTDLNMNWVFVNKTTESLLRRSRAQVFGHHCSEWQAHICNTEQCGIRSLRNGRPQTHYMQDMGDGTQRSMQVDTTYITDNHGKRIGHCGDRHRYSRHFAVVGHAPESSGIAPGTDRDHDADQRADQHERRPCQSGAHAFRREPPTGEERGGRNAEAGAGDCRHHRQQPGDLENQPGDRRDRVPDEHSGAERCRGSRAGRRCRNRIRGCGRRGTQPCFPGRRCGTALRRDHPALGIGGE